MCFGMPAGVQMKCLFGEGRERVWWNVGVACFVKLEKAEEAPNCTDIGGWLYFEDGLNLFLLWSYSFS